MKRVLHRLSAKALDTFPAPAFEHDGGGLYFQVTKAGSRSWIFRFSLHGKTRDMGLGPSPAVSLKQARSLADIVRKQVADGIDPIVARAQGRQIAAASLTVEQAASAWAKAQRPKWKTEKHAAHVVRRLQQHVFPVIGALPIATIKLAEIKLALNPIWTEKHSLALRVRADLQDVIEWSIHEGHREDESNPAELKRLKYSLPTGLHKVRHFPSLPYDQAPAFLAKLRQQDGTAARALEFILSTACRVSDVCGAHKDHSVPMLWSHVDPAAKTWTIPETKSGLGLVVPLSDAAMAVLKEMQRFRDHTDAVFPGARRDTVVKDTTLRRLLKDLGFGGVMTTHGVRACFRTWASETTAYDKGVVEMALAHTQSALDQAYMRGDLLAKRRRLMADWSEFLEGRAVPQGATVIPLRA